MTDTPPDKAPGTGLPNSVVGGGIALIGALMMLFANRIASGGAAEWVSMGGVVVLVLGLILAWSTGPIWETLRSLLIAISIALIVRWAVVEPYRIPSGSMEPTLHGDPHFLKGDRVFVNKWHYGVRVPFQNARLWQGSPPERFDIVVFKSVEDHPTHGTLVKRIVGMPGEQVLIREGRLLVDGETLVLPPDMPNLEYTTAGDYAVRFEPEYMNIPEGHYLLLGDNSSQSRDGRVFGWVPNANLLGRVECIAWPLGRWRDFTGFSQTWWWRGLVALVVLLLLVRIFVGRSIAVPRRTAKGHDHIFVYQLAYGLRLSFTHVWLARWSAPRRGDRVLYRPADNGQFPGDTLLAGVVAGLPGEEVRIVEGRLQIDGVDGPLPSALANAEWSAPDSGEAKVKKKGKAKAAEKARDRVPEGHYYILAPSQGDPPPDARTLGPTPARFIRGRLAFTWWPPARWGRVD